MYIAIRNLRTLSPVALAAVGTIAVACSGDSNVAAPPVATINMCRSANTAAAAIAAVPVTDVSTRRAAGDYVTTLIVSKQTSSAQDSIHFARIGDALAVARAGRLARGELLSGACRITISVGAGVFRGDPNANADPTLEHFPIMVDVPDIAFEGSFKMQVDAAGRAAGTSDSGLATTLSPVTPLQVIGGAGSQTGASTPIFIANAHPTGSAGNGLTIEGFVFQSGHVGIDTIPGGQGVSSMRVQRLLIRGNRFEAGFTESIDLRASSGAVQRNHLGGGGGTCDICLAGPGDFQVSDNRLLAGGIPGILIVPASLLPVLDVVEQFTVPAASLVTATVTNNEVQDHLRKPVGVGIRVGAVGVGAPNVAGTSRVVASSNLLVNNNFAMIVEAAFPVANTTLRGDIDLTLTGNVFQQSCQTDLLVSFSRHTTALGLANAAYLKNSSYTLTLGGNTKWSDAWYSDPAGFSNTLIVDGTTLANGAHAPYDGTRTCAPLA